MAIKFAIRIYTETYTVSFCLGEHEPFCADNLKNVIKSPISKEIYIPLYKAFTLTTLDMPQRKFRIFSIKFPRLYHTIMPFQQFKVLSLCLARIIEEENTILSNTLGNKSSLTHIWIYAPRTFLPFIK